MSNSGDWLSGVTLPRPTPAWEDRSMLALSGPRDGNGLPPSITVARDERRGPADPAGEPFDAYVQRQRQLLADNLPGFRVLRPSPLGAGTPTAADAFFSWSSGPVALTQWVVWLAVNDGTVVTYTATSESARYDEHKPVFEATLRQMGIAPTAFAAKG